MAKVAMAGACLVCALQACETASTPSDAGVGATDRGSGGTPSDVPPADDSVSDTRRADTRVADVSVLDADAVGADAVGADAVGADAVGADAVGADAVGIDAVGIDVADASTAALVVGAPCTAQSVCPAGGSGESTCLTDWPGGYCAVAACADHGHDCPNDGLPGGSKCVLAPTATCLALCTADSDCRDGYDCATRDDTAGHTPTLVCLPR